MSLATHTMQPVTAGWLPTLARDQSMNGSLSPDSCRCGRMAATTALGQQRTPAVHTGSETLLNHPGNLLGGLECRSIKDYAVLLTPQNRGSTGACTMPLTFLRQA